MKLYIFGASGAGVTTLGKALANRLGCAYLDSDDYLWAATNPPYTTKRDKAERNAMLMHDLVERQKVILGGSVVSWELDLSVFDLAIFLYVPTRLRLQRLKEREENRFGDLLVTHPVMSKNFSGLIEWAAGYDTDTTCGRSLSVHEIWLSHAPCPTLEIRGDTSITERVALVLEKLRQLKI